MWETQTIVRRTVNPERDKAWVNHERMTGRLLVGLIAGAVTAFIAGIESLTLPVTAVAAMSGFVALAWLGLVVTGVCALALLCNSLGAAFTGIKQPPYPDFEHKEPKRIR